MRMIDDRTYQLTVPTPFAVGDVHVYLLKGDVLTLVDAGVKTKDAWDALKLQLKEIGYLPNDIEQIVLTHHHPDHTGLIEQFPKIKQIAAHKNVNYWLTHDEAFFQHYERFFRQQFHMHHVPERFYSLDDLRKPLQFAGKGNVTAILKEGERLPGHDEWQIIETLGHAQTHLSFLSNATGTFIGGDHLLHHVSSNPLMEAPYGNDYLRPQPLLQYRSNLKKCLVLDIKLVLPGHGKIFSDVKQLIHSRLAKQEQRANSVYLLLQEGEKTAFSICKTIFPQQYEKQLDLTMSETIGQLDFLEDQGVVAKYEKDGMVSYYAKYINK